FFLLIRRPPISPLFPYTTLFRSEINFHHAEHTHPALPPTSGISGGTFELSENHDPAPDVWYRIYLTATDSEGQSTTVYREVFPIDRKSTRLNSSHVKISYAVFCL